VNPSRPRTRARLSRRDFCFTAAGTVAATAALPGLRAAAQEPEELTPALIDLPEVATFRGDATRSVQGTGTVPRNPVVRWSFETGERVETLASGGHRTWKGTGWSGQAALAGGRVYIPGLDGVCYCRDADTGEAIWQTAVGDSIKGSITLWYDQLLFGSRDDHMHCLAREDGAERWRLACGGQDVDSTPAVVGGRAWFGTEDTHLYCVNAGGEVLWSYTTGGSVESSPAVVGDRAWIGSYDGYLHCVRADTGDLVWKFPTGDDTDSSPVVVGDRVYIGCENGFLYAIERDTGRMVWRYRAGAGIWSTPAVVDGRVFTGSDDALVHCVDARTGEAVWRSDLTAGTWASPTVLDNMVVIGDWDGVLSGIDATSGERVWTFETGSYIVSSACIGGGRIHVGARNGTFYCLEEGPA